MVLALFFEGSRLSPTGGDGGAREPVIDAARASEIGRGRAGGGPCRIVPLPSNGATSRSAEELGGQVWIFDSRAKSRRGDRSSVTHRMPEGGDSSTSLGMTRGRGFLDLARN